MQLSQLRITRLRNIVEATFSLHSEFNLFFGENGSGKTSVLEAISLLTSGKSFRTARQEEAIQFGSLAYVVSGVAEARLLEGLHTRMGVERTRGGRQKIRLNDQPLEKILELTKLLPIQLLNVDSYRFLEEGSLARRQFIDWGVFHVEPVFSRVWQRYNRALQQRNAALKAIRTTKVLGSCKEVHIWEQELCETGYMIDVLRERYITNFIPVFSSILEKMLAIKDVVVDYKRGWGRGETLEFALKNTFMRDKVLGYTTIGPHRADLTFSINSVSAKSVLSRGQLKLFICALLLARAEELFKKTSKKCLLLIDDISSELDNKAAQILVNRLEQLQAQVIITAIDKNLLMGLFETKAYKMFHVEHGGIFAEQGKTCLV